LDITIQKAKIQSIGGQVEDVFFITQNNGERITDQSVLNTIETNICHSLDNES